MGQKEPKVIKKDILGRLGRQNSTYAHVYERNKNEFETKNKNISFFPYARRLETPVPSVPDNSKKEIKLVEIGIGSFVDGPRRWISFDF